MQTQDLLEKSNKLKSKAEALLQEMGESKEYWKIRLLESERWLLARNIDDFQEDVMKQVADKLEEARLPAPNPNNVWIETQKAKLLDPPTLKRVNRYIFSAVIIKNLKIGLITMKRMMKEGDTKFLKVESFETVVRELKKEIMKARRIIFYETQSRKSYTILFRQHRPRPPLAQKDPPEERNLTVRIQAHTRTRKCIQTHTRTR